MCFVKPLILRWCSIVLKEKILEEVVKEIMKLGFSLSSGGLLLPYHMGALQSLEYYGYLNSNIDNGQFVNPVAGSSAGAIATMAHGCGIPKEQVLEATIQVSDACHQLGGARGRLLPLLEHQMEQLVGPEEWIYFEEHQQKSENAAIGIAYQQLFPTYKSHLQTQFVDTQDLFKAVSYSCHFPFFATNWPFYLEMSHYNEINKDNNDSTSSSASVESDENDSHLFQTVDTSTSLTTDATTSTSSTIPKATRKPFLSSSSSVLKLPKVFVDGWFTTAPNRQGCPDLSLHPAGVDRTIAISVFPHVQIGMAFDDHNCISPSIDPDSMAPLEEYLRIATQATSRKELTEMYELGFQNAETWCAQETARQRQEEKTLREAARKLAL